jgi:hypothetical protein
MELWIARDECGYLTLFKTKPEKEVSMISRTTYWDDGNDNIAIDEKLFPEVTFENSPQQVEIKLV